MREIELCDNEKRLGGISNVFGLPRLECHVEAIHLFMFFFLGKVPAVLFYDLRELKSPI